MGTFFDHRWPLCRSLAFPSRRPTPDERTPSLLAISFAHHSTPLHLNLRSRRRAARSLSVPLSSRYVMVVSAGSRGAGKGRARRSEAIGALSAKKKS